MASSMLGGETPRVNPGLAGADRGQTQLRSQHEKEEESTAAAAAGELQPA